MALTDQQLIKVSGAVAANEQTMANAGAIVTTIGAGSDTNFPTEKAIVTYVTGKGYLVDVLTTRGDVMIKDASGVTARLGIGASGYVLGSDGDDIAWVANVNSNPLTVKGDIMVFSTVSARLPIGTNGYVLTADSASGLGVGWAAYVGLTNPMTTRGDIIYSATGNVTTRLPLGTVGQVVTTDGTDVAWGTMTGDNLLAEPAADVTAVGLTESVTVGESVVFGNLLYIKSDGKWWKTDSNAAATMPGLRLALATASADASCSCLMIGKARDDSWAWTVGGLIYASETAGALTQTAPTTSGAQVQLVGVAYHADKISFNPSMVLVEVV